MARTANRHFRAQSDRQFGGTIYRAGNYLRLSVDSDYTGSDSLENQRKLAAEYAAKAPDLVIAKEYIDNGRTGTDFNRPAFMRMIADLKQKTINCVIVKDLSRFGRECVEAGNYIEKVFPLWGIRFISIVDRYDSADCDCDRELLLISLKNLMHEMYARDISGKVGSTFRIKQEQGIFYRSATIPYGYKMDPANRNYCIDEPAAEIVRQIFSLYNGEMSKYAICQYLYKNRVLPPARYRKTGRIYQEAEEPLQSWHLSTIDRILGNPVYMGTILRHTTEQCFFEGKKSVKVPKEETVLIVKNHPPIISAPLFDAVQKKREQVKRGYTGFRMDSVIEKEDTSSGENPFRDKIICGDCGAAMTRVADCHIADGRKKRYYGFRCSAHRSASAICDSKGIGKALLCDILCAVVRKHLLLMEGLNKLIENDLKRSFARKVQKLEVGKQRSINDCAMLQQEYLCTYERYVSGELSPDGFQLFRQSYSEKMSLGKSQLKRLEEEKDKINKERKSVKRTLVAWMDRGGCQELTEDVIGFWIARIEVFAGKRLSVKLCYQDCFAMLGEKEGDERQ